METAIASPETVVARPAWLSEKPRASVIFNEKSGSVTAPDREALLAQIEAAGIADIDMHDVTDMEAAFATKSDCIIILGGDGTARSAAAMAPPDAPPLILLPGGTLNMLPKALYGDVTWPVALTAALTRGEIRNMSGGKANGEAFFIAAIFGAPTLLARAREAVREGHFLSALKRFRHFFKRAFSSKIHGRPDKMRMRAAEAIGILCPSFSGEVSGEDLEWVRLDAHDIFDLVRVGIRALGPDWRNDSTVHARRCSKGEVRGLGAIPGTLDGEPRMFPALVKITNFAKGPRVIFAPHDGADEPKADS